MPLEFAVAEHLRGLLPVRHLPLGGLALLRVGVEDSAVAVHLGSLPEGRKWFGRGVEFLIAWLEY